MNIIIYKEKRPFNKTSSLVGKSCGVRLTAVNERVYIIEDNEAELGEFPWIVSIFSTISDPMKYTCGGSIIHPKVIVSVAHSLGRSKKKLKTWLVRSGDHDQSTINEIVAHQDLQTEQAMF